ncbi:MAG: hypothetical protein ABJB01_13955 [Rudaea sp.]
MPLRALFAALVFAVACARAVAADVVGYSEAFDTLYRVDLTTRTAQEIGRATPLNAPRLPIIEGLTASPAGTLYAVADAPSAKTLLQINATTGLATTIGTLALTGGNVAGELDIGLAFTCDGRLWMSSGTGLLWQVDPGTAAVTFIGNLGVKITGLAALGNVLYGTGSQGNNNLYRIDLSNAATTLVGAYGSNAAYVTTTSAAFDASGQLHAILDYVPPPNDNDPVADWSDLAVIDPASAALSNAGPITASGGSYEDLFQIGLKGLAFVPSACAAAPPSTATKLPSLSAWSMLLLGLLLLVLARGQFSRR